MEANKERRAGILLPVSALPGRYGIGTLGEGAYEWIDFLARSGQRVWQMLPVGPTAYEHSPYQSPSAFAGNPLFIDLGLLQQDGLLTEEEVRAAHTEQGNIRYEALLPKRMKLLRTAARRMDGLQEEYLCFRARQKEWLDEYALFMAVWEALEYAPLRVWPDALRKGEKGEAFAASLRAEAEEWRRLQYLFERQWQAMKAYANERGVALFGDLPIYAGPDSADVWASPELFLMDEDLQPSLLAGCPPDAFSEDGQLWENPLYDWEVHKRSGFSWWLRRFRRSAQLYDMVRLDHFRGLEQYYAIPAKAETAREGEWRPGPGRALVDAIKKGTPELSVVAEDLGFLTPQVLELLEESGWPGMKVLQFAFDGSADNPYLPHRHVPNAVVYTGTHDNPTTVQWLQEGEGRTLEAYAQSGEKPLDTMLRLALFSVCELAVLPMQDWLALGAEGRMDVPGVAKGNWIWRVQGTQLTPALAERIWTQTKAAKR